MVGGFRFCEGPGVEETPAWHCKMPGPCKISDQYNAQERERESLRGRRVLQGPRSRIDYGVALQNAWSLQGLIGVLRPSG